MRIEQRREREKEREREDEEEDGNRREVRQISRGKRRKTPATATQVHMPKLTLPLPSPSFHRIVLRAVCQQAPSWWQLQQLSPVSRMNQCEREGRLLPVWEGDKKGDQTGKDLGRGRRNDWILYGGKLSPGVKFCLIPVISSGRSSKLCA